MRFRHLTFRAHHNHGSSLTEAMKRPEFYPHRPAAVEMRQTHLSYVFLAGDYVYKIKKPVRFPFVDCSSLEKRRRLCQAELRLNRRLAPGIYLAVVAILATEAGYVLNESGNPEQAATEYAVKMRRLPEARILERLLHEHAVTPNDIRAIAERLAAFHAQAAAGSALKFGSPAAVWKLVSGNLEECERFAGITCTHDELGFLQNRNREFVAAHWKMMMRRARQGRVREGHGDLRCEHVCLIDGQTLVFDCVEFSEALRYSDVAGDLAFLAMDLDRLGAHDFADVLCHAYAQEAGDNEMARLMPFYKCYRATVRAKVESLRSLGTEVPENEREQAQASAKKYFELARRYAEDLRNRYMLVVCGLSGSGKSTLARMLAKRLDLRVLSSDPIRKALTASADVPDRKEYGSGIYSAAFNRRTYYELFARAREHLAHGRNVVLDATFRHRDERRAAMQLAEESGARVLFVECRADEPEILRRLDERERSGNDPSDANAAIYLRQRQDFEPFDAACGMHLTVDTTGGTEAAASTVEHALEWLALN